MNKQTKIKYQVTKVIYLSDTIEAYDQVSAVEAFKEKYYLMSDKDFTENIYQSQADFDVQEKT